MAALPEKNTHAESMLQPTSAMDGKRAQAPSPARSRPQRPARPLEGQLSFSFEQKEVAQRSKVVRASSKEPGTSQSRRALRPASAARLSSAAIERPAEEVTLEQTLLGLLPPGRGLQVR